MLGRQVAHAESPAATVGLTHRVVGDLRVAEVGALDEFWVREQVYAEIEQPLLAASVGEQPEALRKLVDRLCAHLDAHAPQVGLFVEALEANEVVSTGQGGEEEEVVQRFAVGP